MLSFNVLQRPLALSSHLQQFFFLFAAVCIRMYTCVYVYVYVYLADFKEGHGSAEVSTRTQVDDSSLFRALQARTGVVFSAAVNRKMEDNPQAFWLTPQPFKFEDIGTTKITRTLYVYEFIYSCTVICISVCCFSSNNISHNIYIYVYIYYMI